MRRPRLNGQRPAIYRRLPAPPRLPRLPLHFWRIHFACLRFWHRFYATRNDRHLKSKTRRRILWRLYRYQKDLLEPLPSRYVLSDVAQLHAHIAVLDSRS
jgi:hypothetical protein